MIWWVAPTISVYVNAAGVSLSVVISVCLQWVAIKRTVVTAVPDPISVRVKLPRVVDQRAIVLCQTTIHACIYTHRGDLNKHLFSDTVSSKLLSNTSLTLSSMMSSLSSSGSQASPCPSMSRSSCPEFGSMGQLSCSQSELSLVQSHPIKKQLQLIRLKFFNILGLVYFYLLTVIGCILLAGQSVIGPAIQIRVLTAQKAITGKPNSTHTLVQDLRCQAQVNALSVLVAGVCVVFARIVWFTHLEQSQAFENTKVVHDCSSKQRK